MAPVISTSLLQGQDDNDQFKLYDPFTHQYTAPTAYAEDMPREDKYFFDPRWSTLPVKDVTSGLLKNGMTYEYLPRNLPLIAPVPSGGWKQTGLNFDRGSPAPYWYDQVVDPRYVSLPGGASGIPGVPGGFGGVGGVGSMGGIGGMGGASAMGGAGVPGGLPGQQGLPGRPGMPGMGGPEPLQLDVGTPVRICNIMAPEAMIYNELIGDIVRMTTAADRGERNGPDIYHVRCLLMSRETKRAHDQYEKVKITSTAVHYEHQNRARVARMYTTSPANLTENSDRTPPFVIACVTREKLVPVSHPTRR